MTLAVLFPGQGSQRSEFLKALPASPAVVATISESHAILTQLGIPLEVDSATALADTTNVQVALVIAGVACARALTDDHQLKVRYVAGHSVSAFAAAVTVGALTLGEALKCIQLRGQLMQHACRDRRWGMAAIGGLQARRVQTLVDEVSSPDDPLWLSNINSATQLVVSGTRTALDRARYASNAAIASTFDILDVNVASHCPVQEATAAALVAELASIPRRPLSGGYITNTGGRRATDAHTVLNDLALSVARPVHWYDATRLLPELGVTCAVQVPPGGVLATLLARNVPSVYSIALAEAGMQTTARRARRHCDQ